MLNPPVSIHPSRRCENCAHVDTSGEYDCWQMVSMADGLAKPIDFACDQHQTSGEFRLELYRPTHVVLGLA
ncbi:MAG: hypothetical protein EOP13_06335 [Pseudomonas sp.]|uniref:hypothetical protein n=1 Tax=Pseudomonas sp. TaxID=306 RepID=UPI0011F9CE6A|nr:hypothetical protein [Pseudomonas sp.]RZI75188.1 MAG: hypothetical protein EOP13_06335 [Pseudomonas sp.]